jgi:L-iditol 2-dehydrogenase
MKAAVLTGLKKIEIKEVPDPKVAAGTDVLVKIGAVGVCGSDIHYYTSGRIGSQVVHYPFIVGHECAGTVQETGGAVTRVKKGDRVAIDPAIYCGACDQCAGGRVHTCRNLLFLGCPGQLNGSLSEYIVIPENCCFPIKKNVTMDQAVLSEPLAIGVYGVGLSLPLKGADIGILGCGPIGLSVLLAAREQGGGRIYATDKIDERLRAAIGAGAAWAGNPDKENVVREIEAQEPLLLDAVFECCGQQDALDQAVTLLKPGGRLILIGIPAVSRVGFDVDELRRKEISIQNVRRQCDCTQQTLDMIQRGALTPDFRVTHQFELEKTPEAFDLVANHRDGVIKAVIRL